MSDCGCEADEERAGVDPAYRRALWIVVILNLGFGVIELAGGFLARSQALKADSLDFIGDGSITLIGLIALGWTAVARSRTALVQGCFLAVLGLGVIGSAIWRSFHAIAPEADLMGGIGVVALLVNISAALVLSRFRNEGDLAVLAQRCPCQCGGYRRGWSGCGDRQGLARPSRRRRHRAALPPFGL